MFAIHLLRGLAGAAIGAVVGYYGFRWALSQGFYAMVVPGACIGLGFSYASGRCENVFGALCAALAVPFSLFVEWQFFPFAADGSLDYFVTHLHQLRGMTWLMIALGTACAFYFGRGRQWEEARPRSPSRDAEA